MGKKCFPLKETYLIIWHAQFKAVVKEQQWQNKLGESVQSVSHCHRYSNALLNVFPSSLVSFNYYLISLWSTRNMQLTKHTWWLIDKSEALWTEHLDDYLTTTLKHFDYTTQTAPWQLLDNTVKHCAHTTHRTSCSSLGQTRREVLHLAADLWWWGTWCHGPAERPECYAPWHSGLASQTSASYSQSPHSHLSRWHNHCRKPVSNTK